MERAVRSDLSVLGRGRLVGLPVLQSKRQPVFRRQRNTLSLLAAWDRRHCRSEGAGFLRRVLRPPGNVSQGRWKRHQSPESDTQWRFGRGVELHLNFKAFTRPVGSTDSGHVPHIRCSLGVLFGGFPPRSEYESRTLQAGHIPREAPTRHLKAEVRRIKGFWEQWNEESG